MKKQFSLLAIAAVLAAPAFADNFYAGGDIGRSKIEADLGNGYSASKNDTAWSVFAGYQFHTNFAAEVGYRDLGKIEDRAGNNYDQVKARAVQASLIGILPVSNEFSVFGRLGLASIKGEGEGRFGNYTYSSSETKTKGLFGIGARYAVTKELGLRAEYNQYSKIEDVKLSTLTIGADYRF
ncbi:porin family protein [Chitinimonas naiadis]